MGTRGPRDIPSLLEYLNCVCSWRKVPRTGFQMLPACRIDYCMVCLSHALYNDLLFPGVLFVLVVTKSLRVST